MALTNVIKEPRRELTESGTGILIAAAVIAAVYEPGSYIGHWFNDLVNTPSWVWLYVLVGMVLSFFGGWIGLVITHEVGESFCNNLAARGIELRGQRVQR